MPLTATCHLAYPPPVSSLEVWGLDDVAETPPVIFPVHHRPVQGTRRAYRVNMRHGVSRIRDGHRHTLGIIFHDAQ